MHSDGRARSLRIAQIAPLHESVPPQLYGGTERVVSWLTEELVARGHDVTLFASGDSRTAARLIPMCERGLRLARCSESLAPHFVMLEEVYRRASEFDVLHFHIDYLHFPVTHRERGVSVTTIHNRLDLPELVPIYGAFRELPVVSISDAQRAAMPGAGWLGTVYHGLPRDHYALEEAPGGYLAFLGRLSPEKRVDRAIEIARRAGLPLRIAAKVDPAAPGYYAEHIAPLVRAPYVEVVGEIGERDKQAFLGGARALLFPIDWPEPFGLVMIEAMACGTPVIAFRCGSVPEVIEPGVSGYIVDTVDEAVAAAGRLGELSRAGCRQAFERRFTADRMARDYLELYRGLAGDPRSRFTATISSSPSHRST
jgi:glycosyltransferase involved in cell wall biosynthesis